MERYIGVISEREISVLNLSNSTLSYPNLVLISVPNNPSSILHAVLKAFFNPYITGILDDKILNRENYVRSLRRDLANKLYEKDHSGYIIYDLLNGGRMRELSQYNEIFELNRFSRLLDSDKYIGVECLELLSNIVDKDIYIIDYEKKDVYSLPIHPNFLYKNRRSIVLLYLSYRFELVGIENNGGIETIFEPDHQFVSILKNRYNDVTNTQ